MRKLAYVLAVGLTASSLLLAQDKESKKDKSDKPVPTDSTQITWYSYDVGLDLAKKTGKHIVVDFTAKWCGYCKKMDKETFTDPEVIKFMNQHFVSVKVDGDSKTELNVNGYKITESNLARAEYRVSGYPTFWFLKSNAERIGPAAGYRPATQFLDMLYFVKDDVYAKMTFEDYMKNGGRKGSN